MTTQTNPIGKTNWRQFPRAGLCQRAGRERFERSPSLSIPLPSAMTPLRGVGSQIQPRYLFSHPPMERGGPGVLDPAPRSPAVPCPSRPAAAPAATTRTIPGPAPSGRSPGRTVEAWGGRWGETRWVSPGGGWERGGEHSCLLPPAPCESRARPRRPPGCPLPAAPRRRARCVGTSGHLCLFPGRDTSLSV